jgi:hypothetical protein
MPTEAPRRLETATRSTQRGMAVQRMRAEVHDLCELARLRLSAVLQGAHPWLVHIDAASTCTSRP